MMITLNFAMRRNLPKLFSFYVNVAPRLSVRTEHDDVSLVPKHTSNQVNRVRTRPPTSSIFQLPIIDSVVPSPTVPKPPSQDKLAEALKSTTSLKELFEIFLNKENSFEEKHLTLAFRYVLQFQNDSNTRYAPDALKNHLGFIKMCQKLRKVALNMTDASSLVVCLKTLAFCHVPADSHIVQTLLHLIKARVNDLELQQIIFLNFLLRKIKCPLADALIIALPVVFQTQLETQLDAQNVKVMCDCLRYAIEQRISATKVKFIADKLMESSSRIKWEASSVCSVIWSLGKVRNLPDYGLTPLLENALSRFAKLVSRLEDRDVEKTLVTMGENFNSRSRHWYNEEACRETAKRVVQEQWPLRSTSAIGRTFSKVCHVNFEFLDYYSALIADSNAELTMHPHYVLAPFAVADYKPPTFDKMMDFLLPYFSHKTDLSKDQQWFRFAVDCASLGFYPHPLINQIFQESFISSHFGKQASELDWLQLDILHRSVRIECPDYQGPYPSPSMVEQCHRKIFEANAQKQEFLAIEKALQTGVGGSPFVASGMLTKYGHFIDHILAMRPGGYPVAINTVPSDTVRYVENISGTSGCQIVLIKVLRSSAYVGNGDRLRGVYALEIRTLERAGYDVVTVNLEKWESLLDYEKIPFLMQQVRLKERMIGT